MPDSDRIAPIVATPDSPDSGAVIALRRGRSRRRRHDHRPCHEQAARPTYPMIPPCVTSHVRTSSIQTSSRLSVGRKIRSRGKLADE